MWLKKLHEDISKHIEEVGQSIISVMPDASHPLGFHYTVGNHSRGKPELLVLGNFDPSQITWLLNDLSSRMRERSFDNDEMINLGGKGNLWIINAKESVKEDFTVAVGTHYKTQDYSVQQVIICDENGNFPPNCEEPYCDIPILRGVLQ